MAEGAEVAFDDLMVLNCWEEITDDAIYQRCTSVAVSAELAADGHVLVGHNEDWLPEDEENVFLMHATPDDEPPFLAMTYGGLLPNIGFNAQGIAQCCDSVYPDDVRGGVPRIFVSRAVLGAARLGEAIRSTLLPARAAGYNHLIADRSGELYNVEISARRFAILYGIKGYLAHTNNYHSRRMKQLEDETEDLVSSHLRVNRATRLLHNARPHNLETLKAILSDHANHPDSICRHLNPEDESPDQGKTIVALIMDLTDLEMHACWGNPCTTAFHTYHLES
jgi:isopenicillin-N N-acyltransferase-like protein